MSSYLEEFNTQSQETNERVSSAQLFMFFVHFLMLLGDNESGKTGIIAKLKHSDEVRKGAGLEYHYLDVNPDYKDGE